MIGDVIEKGTVNSPITSVPHGPTGPVKSGERIFPEYGELRSQGSHLGPVDGSVQFRKQTQMRPRNATFLFASIIGYW